MSSSSQDGCTCNLNITEKLENGKANKATAFVERIAVAKPKFKLANMHKAHLPPTNKKEGYSVGGGLAAFSAQIDGQSKQDILNAMLFAQLGADKYFSRERKMHNWYDYYKFILSNLGFMIDKIEMKLHKTTKGNFTLEEIVTDTYNTSSDNTDILAATVQALLDALSKIPVTDERMKMFHSLCGSSSSGTFQILPCEQGPDGNVVLVMGAFFFNSSQCCENIMFDSWNSKRTKIYKSVHKATFDPKYYAKIRCAVIAKLGDEAVNLVASISFDTSQEQPKSEEADVSPTAFVEHIQIAEPAFRLIESYGNVNLPLSYWSEGYSVAGGLVAFSENVIGQSKKDILNATLLAQLGADKQFSRERNVHQWYDFYNHILQNLGFAIEKIVIQEHDMREEKFTLDEVVMLADSASSGPTYTLLSTLQALLVALRSISITDERMRMFHSLCGSSSSGNFQILPCDQRPDGKVVVLLGTFFFSSSQQHENILLDTWNSNKTKIHQSVHRATFDPEVYAQVRHAVTAKLGDNVDSLVAPIEIKKQRVIIEVL